MKSLSLSACLLVFLKLACQSAPVSVSPLRFPLLTALDKKIVAEQVPGALQKIPFLARDPDSRAILMREKFEDKARLENWQQNTGGTAQRTWMVSQGMLYNTEENELLHAITVGEVQWKDYLVKVKMKINGTAGDPRAGIIFRETDEGFYLFRIHRESNKAQLAYHCKHPFGWNVIMEKQLPADVTDKWYEAMVYVYQDHMACFLDTLPVFNASAPYSAGGRVGLYSVDSKALFDDLTVMQVEDSDTKTDQRAAGSRVSVSEKETRSLQQPGDLVSFWFADYFDGTSRWWNAYEAGTGKPAPWVLYEAGGTAQLNDDAVLRTNEFTRYNMDNFSMVLGLSFAGGADSRFDFFFRKTEKGCLALQFLAREKKVRLVDITGEQITELKSETLPPGFFSEYRAIKIVVHKNRIIAQLGLYSKLLDYKGDNVPLKAAGTFGISCSRLRLVLHSLNAAAVRETDL